MDMIKVILNENLCQINKQQNRNNRPYLNWQFITSHPYLCIGMIIAYLLTAILIYYTPLLWVILDNRLHTIFPAIGRSIAV